MQCYSAELRKLDSEKQLPATNQHHAPMEHCTFGYDAKTAKTKRCFLHWTRMLLYCPFCKWDMLVNSCQRTFGLLLH